MACYEAARRRPDVFSGVIGVTVPVSHLETSTTQCSCPHFRKYRPCAGEYQPIESIAKLIPTLSYQVFFAQNTSKAIVELNRDVGRTLRGTLRSVASPPPNTFLQSQETYMGAWDGIEARITIPFRHFSRSTCLLDPPDSVLLEGGRRLLYRKVQQTRL